VGAFEDIEDFFSLIEENSIDLVIMEIKLQNGSTIKNHPKIKKTIHKNCGYDFYLTISIKISN
tara:strand:+ start:66528 stop:66716 length:189 start_codon:yes stop_codon:yes gene_type:complete